MITAIVSFSVQGIREERNYSFYRNILEELNTTIEQELPCDLYGPGVLVDE